MFKIKDKVVVNSQKSGYLGEKGIIVNANYTNKIFLVAMFSYPYSVWFLSNDIRLDVIGTLKGLKCSK